MSQDRPTAITASVKRLTATIARPLILNMRWWIIARTAWIVIVAITLFIFILSVPAHFEESRTVTTDPNATFYRLRPAEEQALLSLGLSPDVYSLHLNISNLIFLVVCTGVSIWLFLTRPRDIVVMLITFTFVMHGATYGVSLTALAHSNPAWKIPVSLLNSLAWTVALWTFYIFPDGKFIPRWTRVLGVIYTAWVMLWNFIPAIDPFQYSFSLGIVFFLVWFATGVGAQIYRYQKHSNKTQKLQTRLVILGLTIGVAGFFAYNFLHLVVEPFHQPGMPRLLYNAITIPLLFFAPMLLPPITMTISVLRYKLWDIQVVINRTLVYSALTGVLGIFYFISIVLLQQVFVAVTGVQQSSIAVAASTLIIAALFQPVRRRLQVIVDRRFSIEKPTTNPTRPGTFSPNQKLAGMRFGLYEVYDLIGRGGTAEVYKGKHVTLKRDVAIKIMYPDMAAEGDFRIRFEREAQTIAGLRHPNIVQVFDFGDQDGTYYMVMEYIEGQDLSHYLRNTGALSLAQTLPIAQEIAAALDYAHSQGLVHRDVKPSNIMMHKVTTVSPDEKAFRAILTDFGIAKIVGGESGITKTGTLGTLDYMSPEQINSLKEADHRADIYAFGVILYQMLTGQLPFKGNHLGEVVMMHLTQPPPDPRLLVPDMPPDVAAAILQTLAKNPADRYNTAAAVVEAMGLSDV